MAVIGWVDSGLGLSREPYGGTMLQKETEPKKMKDLEKQIDRLKAKIEMARLIIIRSTFSIKLAEDDWNRRRQEWLRNNPPQSEQDDAAKAPLGGKP